ncbi:TadE/TadG family type IV pilus assembly protein [Mesorhizobium sp. SP-1A]|jgi:Flp pilus assembly protein TadG|uniref:TadE/TadG family type IV pilus assembly protein n=1 Tax=Mesorhizobium sp. SP-1A TaxID=3077840 RepID=UPI0028F706CB|nr:TadE/TadG family type IV pilus assembly protein [Mesorhizobium sp. SP-1A]
MRNMCGRFTRSERGSFLPVFAIGLVPLVLAVGMSVDYTMAVSDKASMQNALDAAVLSLTTMDKTATDADRQANLQSAFIANGGQGTATLKSAVFGADGSVSLSATASYSMPTNFMNLAMIKSVPIGVSTSAKKNPALVNASFKIDKASGYWDKKITLYGTQFGQSTAVPLMQITYVYNGKGGTKGYGTTTVLTPDNKGNFTVVAQQQTCTSTTKKADAPAGSFKDGNLYTSCNMNVASATGASIDVSKMNALYLQMDVTTGTKATMKSNDPKTSNFMYLNGTQIASGKTVDIFTAVPCGQPSTQAWEDGGNNPPSPDVTNADFFYTVTGKCDFNKRPSETVLTQ